MNVTTSVEDRPIRSLPRAGRAEILLPHPTAFVIFAGMLAGVLAAAHGGEPDRVRPAEARPAQVRSSAGRTPSPRPQERATGSGSKAASKQGVKVDRAVKQAVVDDSGRPRCTQCQRLTCPNCERPPGDGRNQIHRQCQHGLCPGHCPVRPEVFGFYGTQWRRWPGSGVVRVSNNEVANPARPPAAEVPGADEESREADPATENTPADGEAGSTAEAEATAAFAEDVAGEEGDPDPEAGEAELEDAGQSVEEAQQPEPVATQTNAIEDAPVEDAAADPEGDQEAAAAAPQEGVDEEASSTAWRSFTAAERRRREARQ